MYRTRLSLAVIAMSGLVACATQKVAQQQVFDFSNAGRIELNITAVDSNVLPDNIVQQVSQHLVDWHYPIGAQENTPPSHTLTVTVEPVEHGSTPAGFSFSSGNSDPRAIDFQKTDVLPIRCKLTAIALPQQSGELKMGFSADQTSKLFLSPDKLADHISTVCFNLLGELKWPLEAKTNAAENTLKTPKWMPEIRIETKEVPNSPATPVAPVEKTDKPGLKVETTPPTDSEHRKQIIIYNQGSPVILELGHQRR